MKSRYILATLVTASFITYAVPASASSITGSFTTGGNTVCTSGPSASCSMTSNDSSYSILRYVFGSPVLFGDLTNINIDYMAVYGGIGGGSPRLALATDANNDGTRTAKSSCTGARPVRLPIGLLGGNTGNLMAMFDNGRYDLGGIGGSAYTDREHALAIAEMFPILRASLIIDSYGGNDRGLIITNFAAEGDVAAVPEPASLLLMGTGLLPARGSSAARTQSIHSHRPIGPGGRWTFGSTAFFCSRVQADAILLRRRPREDEVAAVRHRHLRQRLRIHHGVGGNDAVEVQQIRGQRVRLGVGQRVRFGIGHRAADVIEHGRRVRPITPDGLHRGRRRQRAFSADQSIVDSVRTLRSMAHEAFPA